MGTRGLLGIFHVLGVASLILVSGSIYIVAASQVLVDLYRGDRGIALELVPATN